MMPVQQTPASTGRGNGFMFEAMVNSDGIDVLSRVMQFTGQRHRLIVNNIANLSTPGYLPEDVDPQSFQSALSAAIDKRRSQHHGHRGPLQPADSRQITFSRDSLTLHPTPSHDNILFHDRNDRDLERTMQDLTENLMVYRQAAELLRGKFATLSMAIRERI